MVGFVVVTVLTFLRFAFRYGSQNTISGFHKKNRTHDFPTRLHSINKYY